MKSRQQIRIYRRAKSGWLAGVCETSSLEHAVGQGQVANLVAHSAEGAHRTVPGKNEHGDSHRESQARNHRRKADQESVVGSPQLAINSFEGAEWQPIGAFVGNRYTSRPGSFRSNALSYSIWLC